MCPGYDYQPDCSPDGRWVAFVSQIQQPQVSPVAGVKLLAMEQPMVRAGSIAFISNRDGDTSLWVQDVLGGAQRLVVAKEKHYLKAMGHLTLTIVDPSGSPTHARVSVIGEDGRAYAPDDAWMHAEDSFGRSESAFESHYFHSPGKAELAVPVGRVQVEVMKGFEYYVERQSVICSPNARLVIHLKPLEIPTEAYSRWASADLHVMARATADATGRPDTKRTQCVCRLARNPDEPSTRSPRNESRVIPLRARLSSAKSRRFRRYVRGWKRRSDLLRLATRLG